MRTKSTMLVIALVLLAGCGKKAPGEPTDEEMKAVVSANIKADVERTQQRDRHAGITFEGLTKFESKGCTALPEPKKGWSCAFSMTMKMNGQEISNEHTGTFTRDDKGTLIFTP